MPRKDRQGSTSSLGFRVQVSVPLCAVGRVGSRSAGGGYSPICSFFHSTTFTHFPVAVGKIVYVDSILGPHLKYIEILISNASEGGGWEGN